MEEKHALAHRRPHIKDTLTQRKRDGQLHYTSKSVPASTRLEDPSRKGTTRTAKSAPFNPCPSREGPYSTVFSVSRPIDPLMWLAGLLALSGDVETNPGPTTQTWTCDMCSTEITGRQTSYKCNSITLGAQTLYNPDTQH